MTDEARILLRDDAGGVCTLTLNRPAQFNALSAALVDAIQRELDAIAADERVRVVVIAAAGRAFCAGHDLKELQAERDEARFRALFARCGAMMQSILALPQPVIAQVQGVATAAGCQLVATCDLAISARSARFATSGINLGLFCATPAVAVSRALGRKRAFELLFTGDFVDAETARSIGLVNRVVEDDALADAVSTLARSIATKLPLAVRTGKRMFYEQLALPVADAYRYAGDVMAENLMDADTGEGVQAFIEKRDPAWQD